MALRLIIIGGGILQVPLIQKALDLRIGAQHIEPIVFDSNPQAPGFRILEGESMDPISAPTSASIDTTTKAFYHSKPQQRGLAVLCSTLDASACLKVAKELHHKKAIHAVLTAGTDASVSVATIAADLGLVGVPVQTAIQCTHKVHMRRALEAAGLPIPKFRAISSLEEARRAMHELCLPLVLKPVLNMGSRGVSKIEKASQLKKAWILAQSHSVNRELIIEEYIPGTELSIDALACPLAQKAQIHGIADRIFENGTYFIEKGHNMPTSLETAKQVEAGQLMYKAMGTLGIYAGAAKGDIRLSTQGNFYIGEIAARLSGGFMSSGTYPLHSKIDLLEAVIRIALGQPLGPNYWSADSYNFQSPQIEPQVSASTSAWNVLPQAKRQVAIERSLILPAGKLLKLAGKGAMEAIRGIAKVIFTAKEGDMIAEPKDNTGKAGHILACADSLEEAEMAVQKAMRKLIFQIDESYGVDWESVHQKARESFGLHICWVCKTCDGQNCASQVPGMGGLGTDMLSFKDNSLALSEIHIVPQYIRKEISHSINTQSYFCSRLLEQPVMGAPMTGASTNMNAALSETELQYRLLTGCSKSGTLAWLGDGASPQKYLEIFEAFRLAQKEAEDQLGAVLICKPRAKLSDLKLRFEMAERYGFMAVGIDIDAIAFKTLHLHNQKGKARTLEELREIRSQTKLPFVLKGVLSTEDALRALEIGADAIVVSNHGGRVLEHSPGTARILPRIAQSIAGRIPVLVDGGIRSGQDVFKMLALGAQAVLIGRPLAIAAVGGASPAVTALLRLYKKELRSAMNLCGCSNLEMLRPQYLSFRNRSGA